MAAVGGAAFLVMAVAVVTVAGAVMGLFHVSNPFTEETIDRTGPSVLKSLNDISEYHAASAYYETVVDIEKDTNHLPDFVSGERVLYVGKGDVDAIVDFGELDEKRVSVSDDRLSVTVELPVPTADEPVLDIEESYVVDHDEGLANKFSGSELERDAQLRAMEQMTEAAAEENSLIDRAKENTIAMLRGLFGSLGFTDITVTFEDERGSGEPR